MKHYTWFSANSHTVTCELFGNSLQQISKTTKTLPGFQSKCPSLMADRSQTYICRTKRECGTWFAVLGNFLRGKPKYTSERTCGGHRDLAHPRRRDSLLPTRHLLINTESESLWKWLVEKFQSVCGCDAQWVQQASGRQYRVYTRRSGAYVCVLCVWSYIPNTTTAETTSVTPTWSKHATSAFVIWTRTVCRRNT